MPNNITLRKAYADILDEVYKEKSLTTDLDMDKELLRAGANANEIMVPMIEMDGLADYEKNSGYTSGSITFKYETMKYNYDRGRKFIVDAIENEETANQAFSFASAEFVRTKVVPEIDAFRMATYSSKAGKKVEENPETGKSVLISIRRGVTEMDDNEVSGSRILYISNAHFNRIKDIPLTESTKILEEFDKIVPMPSSRFYTAIDLLKGKDGEEIGGYKKSSAGKDINFIIIEKSAAIQTTKHQKPRIFSPEENQDADAWKYTYRNYGLVDVYKNKTAGIYVSHSNK